MARTRFFVKGRWCLNQENVICPEVYAIYHFKVVVSVLSLALIYPKRLQSYDPTVINGLRKDGARIFGRTDGRTDKHSVDRTITFNRSCNVLKVNPSVKTAYCVKRMPKQTTILNLNSISILGIPITYSRHNGKCNICVIHEEIKAFEG